MLSFLFNFLEMNCTEFQPVLFLFANWTLGGTAEPVNVVIIVVYSAY